MSELYYDLHIHTALSPCADNDMTPNNITQMAALKGLDVIAITDHNEAGNARACIEAARGLGLPLVVVPGMELETAEEAHVVCLFGDIDAAEAFGRLVAERLPNVPNRKEIFGEQLYMDAGDNVTGERAGLLLTATSYTIEEAFAAVRALGGVAIPAHVDRDSYSVLSALGMVPDGLGAGPVEISRRADAAAFWRDKRRLLGGARGYVTSSDAHNLADIAEAERTLAVSEKNAGGVIAALLELRVMS